MVGARLWIQSRRERSRANRTRAKFTERNDYLYSITFAKESYVIKMEYSPADRPDFGVFLDHKTPNRADNLDRGHRKNGKSKRKDWLVDMEADVGKEAGVGRRPVLGQNRREMETGVEVLLKSRHWIDRIDLGQMKSYFSCLDGSGFLPEAICDGEVE